ncbi:MAG TPA: methyltransferase domain-containing protein [Thermoanaerobaculia bacterium]|nr:methyltransferase domain-containing protein [Thermoanaerobaculia bacterium]
MLRLIDPVLRGDEIVSGRMVSAEGDAYSIENGIPNFVDPALLTALEAQTKDEYDRVAAEIYDIAVNWQFAAMNEDENAVRESMVDMLDLHGGERVLEAGCGTGRDSFRLARRLASKGRLHMQDLSPLMVAACVRTMSDQAATLNLSCSLDYSVSNATALPFPDDFFDTVFHFGGFNQFGDLRKGAAELTRVAKPGGRILIGDEAVAPWLKGTEFEAVVTTNNALFKAEIPLAALPESAMDVVVRWIIGNCFYVISFRKGDGLPPLNLDLAHQGWRGGTMRSRYFGVLEGVTVEAKALAKQAAAKAGVSVHEWLDRLVKAEAAVVLDDPKGKP